MAFPQISRRALGLLLVIAAAAAIVSPATADEVVALTEADFEKEVGQDRGALVEFYAPWFELAPFVLYHAGLYFDRSYGNAGLDLWTVVGVTGTAVGPEIWIFADMDGAVVLELIQLWVEIVFSCIFFNQLWDPLEIRSLWMDILIHVVN